MILILTKMLLMIDNDLVVSVTSQLGGLPKQIRHPNGNDIPNQSAIYCNTVHSEVLHKR